MPVARFSVAAEAWIPRRAEEQFINYLAAGKPAVLPLMGAGGSGKSSLLRRFFNHCEQRGRPVLLLDLPRLGSNDALEVLLRVEAVHMPAFNELRKQLRSTYEALSAVLQSYGEAAGNAADLLQKSAGGDAELGLVVGTVRDVGRVVFNFLQREENRRNQDLLKKPEEALWRALRQDCEGGGVILIDTLEQARAQSLATRLEFLADGGIATRLGGSAASSGFLDYSAGLAHFLFDLPVLMVMAGRPPAIRELGWLDPAYIARPLEAPAFVASEVADYMARALPRDIATPSAGDVRRLLRLTQGNPFLLERLARLLIEWQPRWQWSEVQWQPLEESFRSDDRYGLLLFVTQRLHAHVLPGDRAFFRLALPRQRIDPALAGCLFPPEEFGESGGLRRLALYEEKGTLFRYQPWQGADTGFYLHDETRAAFAAWARRDGLWLDAAAVAVHARLAAALAEKAHWPEINKRLLEWAKLRQQRPEDAPRPPDPVEFDDPALLEAAFHSLMADGGFEARYPGYTRESFWQKLSASISLNHAEKMNVCAALPDLSLLQIRMLHDTLSGEHRQFSRVFSAAVQDWLQECGANGSLPGDWAGDAVFIRQALERFPCEDELLRLAAECLPTAEVALAHQRDIQARPDKARALAGFARFVDKKLGDPRQAEALYDEALVLEPDNALVLDSYARFVDEQYDDTARAADLFERAALGAPGAGAHLKVALKFLLGAVGDPARAERLVAAVLARGGTDALGLAACAAFVGRQLGDHRQAERLYEKALALAPDNADILGDYAAQLSRAKRDPALVRAAYERALHADSSHEDNSYRFANFLHRIRKDPAAEAYYGIALMRPHRRLLIDAADFCLNFLDDDEKTGSIFIHLAADEVEPEPELLKLIATFLLRRKEAPAEAERIFAGKLAQRPDDGWLLLAYGEFLAEELKQPERAEAVFERAATSTAKNTERLGDLAQYFLTERQDLRRMKQLLVQAAADDVADANDLANLAWLHFAAGDIAAGAACVERAFALRPVLRPVLLELWFYCYAHLPEHYPEARQKVIELLEQGIASPGWDLSANLAQARLAGHPAIAELIRLADRISSRG